MDTQNNKGQKTNRKNQQDNTPFGDGGKRKEDEPKFNYFWVYAIIFAFIVISVNLSFFQENVKESNFTELREMLTEGDVDHISVVNEKVAEVYVKESVLNKARYTSKKVDKNRFGSPNKGPHFFFTVSSGDKFTDQVNEFYKANPTLAPVNIKFETRTDWVRDTIPWLLPIILLIGFWIFMLRRAGGGIGGAGGNIFNIGKSKAILFDRSEERRVGKEC